jgi:hypothetical protein
MSNPEAAQVPSLGHAFRQLARARAQELWLRATLWAWCMVSLGWLLPLGAWSATRLALPTALLIGGVLASCGAVLGLLHRRTSSTKTIREAIAEVRRSHLTAEITIDAGDEE